MGAVINSKMSETTIILTCTDSEQELWTHSSFSSCGIGNLGFGFPPYLFDFWIGIFYPFGSTLDIF